MGLKMIVVNGNLHLYKGLILLKNISVKELKYFSCSTLSKGGHYRLGGDASQQAYRKYFF
jgi:hypothetical protein